MARSVIDVPDLSTDELEALMDTAEDIIARPDDYADFANNYKSEALINRPGKCSVILSSGGVRPAIMVDLNKIK